MNKTLSHRGSEWDFFQLLRRNFSYLAQLAQLAGSFCHFAEVGMSQINGLDGIGS
jgi:hypothetical protein